LLHAVFPDAPQCDRRCVSTSTIKTKNRIQPSTKYVQNPLMDCRKDLKIEIKDKKDTRDMGIKTKTGK
jgi:hypothetical protein